MQMANASYPSVHSFSWLFSSTSTPIWTIVWRSVPRTWRLDCFNLILKYPLWLLFLWTTHCVLHNSTVQPRIFAGRYACLSDPGWSIYSTISQGWRWFWFFRRHYGSRTQWTKNGQLSDHPTVLSKIRTARIVHVGPLLLDQTCWVHSCMTFSLDCHSLDWLVVVCIIEVNRKKMRRRACNELPSCKSHCDSTLSGPLLPTAHYNEVLGLNFVVDIT